MNNHMTYFNLVTEFVKNRETKGMSPRTITFYKWQLHLFTDWLTKNGYADMEVNDTTPALLEDFFDEFGKTHNQGGKHAVFRSIKAMLNFYDFRYEPNWKNPIKKVKVRPNKIPPLPELPLESINLMIGELINTTNPQRDLAITYVLLDTGLRASELSALNIGDYNNGTFRILKGKGSKYRLVFLGDKSSNILKVYLRTRKNVEPDKPLFIGDNGKRLGYCGLREIYRRVSKKSGVEFKGLHSFRRTFALTLYRRTRDIYLVSGLLGHSSIEVTKRYLHLNNEDYRSQLVANSPADMLN